MKMRVVSLLFVLLLMALFLGAAHAAPVLTISPNVISNTYAGPVTLQLTGLTSGDTVVVQKFLDANANGTVDAGDQLWQQFQVTDGQAGMAFGTVTNNNVPGDTDASANGQITTLLYPGHDFTQVMAGKYLYVISSPAGHFAPLTNSFTVTNFAFAQTISGIVSNSVAPLPYADVILFPANTGSHGLGNPVGGTVANGSGAYSVKVPVGTYYVVALQSNYVAALAQIPQVTLTSGATATANIPVTSATVSISGSVVDAANSGLKLPGCLVTAQSTNNQLAIGFSDTNGNFTIPATPGKWKVNVDSQSLAFIGYLSPQTKTSVNTSGGDVTGVSLAYPKATAAFYGTVKDNLGHPLSNVAIYSSDNNGLYEMDGYSDTNGNYVVGAVGGLSGDSWYVSEDYGGPANYIYSFGASATLGTNQVYHYNFFGILATNTISGNVQFNGSPVAGVGVSANDTINGVTYNSSSDTDNNGNYSINVASGLWSVNVFCSGGGDSLDNILGVGNYQCPNGQNVSISNNTGTANFTIQPPGGGQIFGYVKDTSANPIGSVNVYITDGLGDNYSTVTDGTGYYSINVNSGTWYVSLDCTELNNLGYNCAGTNSVSISNNSIESDFTVQATSQPLQITNASLPNATVSGFYSAQFGATGGQPPYNWSIALGSANPPASLTLNSSGVLSGTPATNGLFTFKVQLTDASASVTNKLFGLIVNPRPSLLMSEWITNRFLLQINGASNQSYTVLVSTNLASTNWVLLLTTNNTTTNSFIVSDPNATNAERFYRVRTSP